RRASRRELTDHRTPGRLDRPSFVLDHAVRPARVLADALPRRVERFRHQLDAGEAGQLADPGVDLEKLLLSLLIVEQIERQRIDLLLLLDALTDRDPHPVEHPAVALPCALVAAEPLLGG